MSLAETLLDCTEPLTWARGSRMPLFQWSLCELGTRDDAEAARRLAQLDRRGLAVTPRWRPSDFPDSLEHALWLGRLQRRLELKVPVNANECVHRFFDGSEETAHIDAEGRPFFDRSFGERHAMGCPFTAEARIPAIRRQVMRFAEVYREAGLAPDFVFADWEIDGPIEWNGAWAASKRCERCRRHIADIDDFSAFQRALRTIRARLLRESYAEPLRALFPDVLVGNYAVYPQADDVRYWYDFFEQFVEGAPYEAEGDAKYRRWFDEWPLSELTLAMPTIYAWYRLYDWYDFAETDYRWFYNMLRIGNNVTRVAQGRVPTLAFVHRRPTAPPEHPDPAVRPFGEAAYRELLWHLLLRGVDGFVSWCLSDEMTDEVPAVHAVYAASLEYAEFFERGEPLTWMLPERPAPVVSARRLGGRLLVRRTDFGAASGPIRIDLEGRSIHVPSRPGECQVLSL